MNILSISQVKTQTAQSDLSQIAPAQTQEREKSSFVDFLRSAQLDSRDVKNTENEKSAEKISERDAEKVAKDENGEKTQPEEKLADKRNPEKEKSEKIAKKSSSENEKAEVAEEDSADKGVPEENFIVVRLNQIQNEKKLSGIDEKSEKVAGLDSENLKDSKIDDKTLAWLLSSSKIDESEEISNEDFSALIDAAAEFIPGSESEEEKLESAQNLAVSDPRLFLDALSENADQIQRGAVKSELALDSDKKIASNKDSNEKKSGAKLSVHDLRTHRLFEDNSAKVDSSKIVQKAAEKKEITLSMQQQNENNVQMTMELAAKAQENITSSSSQAAGAAGSDFQAMLSNAVQENAPDFVKAGNIVLKDNNQGTINLILRPEGLGNVKISLNLDDKNLSAQITVQTKEAMDAFRESISSLKQAFTESGFETGSFDLNFSNNQNQQGFAQSGEQGQNQQNSGILAHKSYGEFVTADALASGEMTESSSEGSYAINIVA